MLIGATTESEAEALIRRDIAVLFTSALRSGLPADRRGDAEARCRQSREQYAARRQSLPRLQRLTALDLPRCSG